MPNAARKVVLDASALLMVLQREPGCERVEPHLGRAVMSALNLAEVATVLGRRGLPGSAVLADVYKIVPDIRPFDAEQASFTVSLDEKTKAFGLSLAARACLALGVSTGFLVLTADQTWLNLDLGVKIEVIQSNSVIPLATATV